MGSLQVFKSPEFGELGILVVNGKEYFPATDCAEKLGYSDPYDAIRRHTKGSVKHPVLTAGGLQTVNFIPEGDLYRLIIRSKLPAAERFETWVFDEVLPSIRKTGAYVNSQDQVLATMARVVESMATTNQQIIDLHNRVLNLEQNQAGPVSKPEGAAKRDGVSTTLTPAPVQIAPAYPVQILAQIYEWALDNQNYFYGRGNHPIFGRWDKGNWNCLSLFPDVIRQAISLRYDGDPNEILWHWRDRGWLDTASEKGRFTKVVHLGSGKRVRMVSIKRRPLQRVSTNG